MVTPRTTRAAVLAVGGAFAAVTALCLPFLLTGTDVPTGAVVLGRWTAALASLVAVRSVLGPGHLARLWRLRPASPRELLASYGLALAVVVPAVALPAAVGVALGAGAAPASTWLAAVPVVVLGTLLLAVSTAGEEVLWRGQLQGAVARHGFWRTSSLVGGVWAAWHLPLHLTYLHQGALTAREALLTTVGLVAWAPLLAALVERRGTVWPAVFAHAVPVSSTQLLAAGSTADAATSWAVAVASWTTLLVAAALVRRRAPASADRQDGRPPQARQTRSRDDIARSTASLSTTRSTPAVGGR